MRARPSTALNFDPSGGFYLIFPVFLDGEIGKLFVLWILDKKNGFLFLICLYLSVKSQFLICSLPKLRIPQNGYIWEFCELFGVYGV